MTLSKDLKEQLVKDGVERYRSVITARPEDLVIDGEAAFEKWLAETLDSYAAQRDREHLEVYRWLMGHYDFPPRPEGGPAYWWRNHLRRKLEEIGITGEKISPADPQENKKP